MRTSSWGSLLGPNCLVRSVDPWKHVDNKIFWNRNGKLFIEITEDNYETCGITTHIIDGHFTFSGYVWSNIEHAIISRPKPLFNFQCIQFYNSTTARPEDIDIGEISDDKPDPPRIVRHNTQQIQIELFLSAPGSVFDFFPFSSITNMVERFWRFKSRGIHDQA